jgi:hypothetical protein
MMRKLLAAVLIAAAPFALTMAPEAAAQTPPPPVARPAPSAADSVFYFKVARMHVLNAADYADVNWSLEGRAGTIRFSNSATEGAVRDCRDFFVRELTPTPKSPVTGRLCTSEPAGAGTGGQPAPTSTSVTERGTRYDLQRIEIAPTGGPRVGAARGITVPRPPPVVAAPPPPAAPAPRSVPPPAARPAPPPTAESARPGVVRRSAQREITIKPVLVQIGKGTARANQNGGHAVVLLSSSPQTNARNLALCEALLNNFDDAPLSDILVGVRREADGTISALRAIYWPVDDTRAVAGDRCPQRLQRYDYTRAQTIRDKHRLPGPGPYLLVSRGDEQQAAAINLAGMAPADIEKATLYFRDAFSQKGNIWNPQGYNRQREEQSLIARWGAGFSRTLVAAVGFYSGTANAGAAGAARACLGDLKDERRC